MKHLLIITVAAMFSMLVGCNQKNNDNVAKNSSSEEKNLAAFNVVSNAFETGNVSGIDSVVADDYVDHSDRGDIKGRDSLKAMIVVMHDFMKNGKTETIHKAAKDDFVYGWMRYTGTSNGEMGMPVGPYDMQSVEVVKFKDGKATEHWAFMEMQDVMEMMAPPAKK